jgi:hypothetical protein
MNGPRIAPLFEPSFFDLATGGAQAPDEAPAARRAMTAIRRAVSASAVPGSTSTSATGPISSRSRTASAM